MKQIRPEMGIRNVDLTRAYSIVLNEGNAGFKNKSDWQWCMVNEMV